MAHKPEGGVTIGMIAKIAGTSKMTVSRVINKKGNVADKTRERIEQVIRELNYSPNVFARNLATNKTGIIGLIAGGGSPLASEFRNIILGVENEACACGYDVLFMADHRHQDLRQHIRPSLVEGIVYFGSRMDFRIVNYLEDCGIPYVLIGKRDWENYRPDFCSADYCGGYREATEYLLSLGHEKIAMVGGYLDFEADILKFEGYWNALEQAGLNRDRELEVTEDQLERLAPLLEKQRATALIVNGSVAWNQLLSLVAERNYRIPEDFSVVLSGLGIDYGVQSIRYLLQIEEMTRLEIPDFQMGAQAARRLLQRLSGEEEIARENYLQMNFVRGGSCKPRSR